MFKRIWNNIILNEGKIFQTKTGVEFTYEINGNEVVTDIVKYPINKSQFKLAYDKINLGESEIIYDIVRGPAYVYAILNDKRINKSMNIREANVSDAKKVLDMFYRLDHEVDYMLFEPGERKTTLSEMEDKIEGIKSSGGVLFVAEDDNSIVGFLSGDRIKLNRVEHCVSIAVGILTDYRNKGYGTMFFNSLENWAKENNIIRLELTVIEENNKAFKLYERLGFEVEGIRKKSIKIEDNYINEYYMAKIL